MIARLRRPRFQLLTGGAQIALLVIGIQVDAPEGWLVVLPAIAAISLWAWTANFRRYRLVDDMPTSQVASAAQGYVELLGRAENHPDIAIIAPLSKRSCCWYQYRLERRTNDNKWLTEDSGESAASFALRDATGACTVDPEGAEVVAARKETWTHGGYRSTEWWIAEGDTLYALGELRTAAATPTAAERRDDVNQLLADWKRDKPELLRRFDLNRDGAVDMAEWQLARAEAKRQVDRNHEALRNAPPHDRVGRPNDGRLFLIANLAPKQLVRRYVIWAWANLAAFAASLSAFAYAIS